MRVRVGSICGEVGYGGQNHEARRQICAANGTRVYHGQSGVGEIAHAAAGAGAKSQFLLPPLWAIIFSNVFPLPVSPVSTK